MNEVTRIQDQLRKSFEGGAWHGPAVWEILKDISAKPAYAKPLPHAHSIWEITLHISGWQAAVNERLHGNPVKEPQEGDWPSINNASETAWQQTLSGLKNGFQILMKTIETIPESKLNQPIVDGFSTYYETIHGLIQHNIYHAGQIALLKKST